MARCLPHEHTTPKAKDDRLNLLRATRHQHFADLGTGPDTRTRRPPPGRCSAERHGDRRRRRRARSMGDHRRVRGSTPSANISRRRAVIVADGHHRYEVARAFRDEQRERERRHGGDYDAVLAYVVELDDDAAHRRRHPPLGRRPARGFRPARSARAVLHRRAGRRSGQRWLWSRRGGSWQLVPRDRCSAHALDSSRVAEALAALPDHELTYQHGKGNVVRRRSRWPRRRRASCCARPPSSRSPRPGAPVSACRPRPRSSGPSRAREWCSARSPVEYASPMAGWPKSALYTAVGLVALGGIIIFLAWNGAAGKDYAQGQIPYLISGGVGGLALSSPGFPSPSFRPCAATWPSSVRSSTPSPTCSRRS